MWGERQCGGFPFLDSRVCGPRMGSPHSLLGEILGGRCRLRV
jgi:hypothetical protein